MKFRLILLFCYPNLQVNMSILFQYCGVCFTSVQRDYLNHANYEIGRSEIKLMHQFLFFTFNLHLI